MPGEDTLLTIAEFGVALAGFTSIIVVFSRRGDLVDVDRFRVRNALLGSLGAAFFALVPSTLLLLGLSGVSVWQIASATMVLYLLVLAGYSMRMTLRLDEASRALLGRVPPFMIGAMVLMVVLQALNVLGVAFEPQSGIYVLGLLGLLMTGAFGFLRTLFVRPSS